MEGAVFHCWVMVIEVFPQELITFFHVHIAIGIIIHQLVDAADRIEAELLILTVAKGLVNPAKLFCSGLLRISPRAGSRRLLAVAMAEALAVMQEEPPKEPQGKTGAHIHDSRSQ